MVGAQLGDRAEGKSRSRMSVLVPSDCESVARPRNSSVPRELCLWISVTDIQPYPELLPKPRRFFPRRPRMFNAVRSISSDVWERHHSDRVRLWLRGERQSLGPPAADCRSLRGKHGSHPPSAPHPLVVRVPAPTQYPRVLGNPQLMQEHIVSCKGPQPCLRRIARRTSATRQSGGIIARRLRRLRGQLFLLYVYQLEACHLFACVQAHCKAPPGGAAMADTRQHEPVSSSWTLDATV
jgi:hypothetical protein